VHMIFFVQEKGDASKLGLSSIHKCIVSYGITANAINKCCKLKFNIVVKLMK
jgi:hypothetical protein